MREGDPTRDIAAAGLGLVAIALGAAAVLGVIQIADIDAPGHPGVMGALGLLAGMVGLYFAPSRGKGRKLATFGTSVAFVALGIYLGAVAIDWLIDYSQRT